MNCAEFVEFVLKKEFGKSYSFPQSKKSIFLDSDQIKSQLNNYVRKTNSPKDGDLVLMHGKRLMCHIGIYVRIGWTEYVLHTEGSIKNSSLHRIGDIINYGYTLEGFYKWQK